MNNKKSTYRYFILFLFILFGLIFQFYRSAFLQEPNAFMIISTTMFLEITGKEMVKVPFSGDEYVGKTRDDSKIIIDFMSQRGYQYKDSIGRFFTFTGRDNQVGNAQGRQFTSRYTLWHINLEN